MPAAPTTATLHVALIGNPNTGKSTLFNALAGVRQRVGNYPGVTVEKKIGRFDCLGRPMALVDLPGTYSLAPRSLDEMVAVDVLLGRRQDTPPPDAVVCIVDAANLERNLYLVSQVRELGLPTVVALNMIDVATDHGVEIDLAQLQRRLGVPVVAIQANRRRGLDALKKALLQAIEQPPPPPESPFPEPFRREVEQLEDALRTATPASTNGRGPLPRYLVERLLLDSGGYLEEGGLPGVDGPLRQRLAEARGRLREAGLPVPAVEAMARYDWVARLLDGVVLRPSTRRVTLSDRLDRLLTHRVAGTAVFAVVMLLLFSSIFIAAEPLMKLIDTGMQQLGEGVESVMAEGALRSLLVDGLIGGVGSVVAFLPQIMILFLFIAILEDCGYMARAAYLMDRLMSRVGLSGKSFIPLLSSFACAIPGVMATRVIENPRDRLTTILVAPLMSCSARLPVYTLLIGAFIPAHSYWGGVLRLQGLTLLAMYCVGIVTAVIVALVLKKTLLRGATPPFVMELPPYKIPSPAIVVHRMLDRGWAFVKRAGTLIVAVAIVVWAMLYYPHRPEVVEHDLQQEEAWLVEQLQQIGPDHPRRPYYEEQLARFQDPDQREQLEASAYQRHSLLGHIGHFIEPAVRPLGWDWRIGCAVVASFPAREVVLGTLGVIYNLGDVDIDEAEGRTQLQAQLRNATWDGSDEPVFNIPVALSLMVFFALCAQCAATLVIIRRETNSWRWPLFTFVYMTTLAYLSALATYQIGMRLIG